MQENLKYWLALNKITNLGPVTIRKLWEHFGSIEKVWGADEDVILSIEGLNRLAVKSFIQNRSQVKLEDELEKISKERVSVLTLEDKDYPELLKNIYDPPPVLYIKGKGFKKEEKMIGIVGTRRASRYGKEVAKKLAFELSQLGMTIVSGMAIGIDTCAHQGSIEAKGKTIAVLGCGVDVVYPPQNRGLAKEIESCGALLSEFSLGTETEKGSFPRRNRIISGLSLGVIVVEGHYDSGAMITAKLALEQGREVFAVPGQIELEQSKGPHWLIKQGAKLVESVEDVLEELNIKDPRPTTHDLRPEQKRDYSNLSAEEQKIVSVLSLEPKHIDRIAADSKLPISQVSSLLMMLEVKKIICQLPGKNFTLT